MKRAVLMIIDGLRADMVTPGLTPNLCNIARRGRVFRRHRSVFPSATRVNSASIATGCLPSRHGLFGNAIALDEGEGLRPVSVGPADFRERLRRATGRTLHVPTLAEHLANSGGVAIYSNSSAGAAHMQDPDGHGWLYHRSGSHGPGLKSISADPMATVGYDATGDTQTVKHFCNALLADTDIPLFITWICEPDHSQHTLELGSDIHKAIIQQSDMRAAEVETAVNARRQGGDDVLLILGSDHGHETIDRIVPVENLLIEAGFKSSTDSTDVVFASSGMGALIYLAHEARDRCGSIAEWLSVQSWCDAVYAGDTLEAIGLQPAAGLAIAFSMAKQDAPNRHGIQGLGHVAGDRFTTSDAPGHGQHGGLGTYETRPFLIVEGGGFKIGTSDRLTRTTDIAPTLLRHLGVDSGHMDGVALPTSD
ncbi:MAG: alkaline phosphatase family protein [Pseudomonadota bacterium]|nr:alkaline phosphatase family protein [Pseudomonadota bacterium]